MKFNIFFIFFFIYLFIFFYFFFFFGGGGYQKSEYFLGYDDFVDILWGSSQNWTSFRGHFYAFQGLSLRSYFRMGIFLWVAYISNISLGMPDVPRVFLGS